MAYLINTARYNDEVANVVNTNNSKIKASISDFNAQLNILGNGETWIGGSAVENVNNLVQCYNTYKDSYSEFIRKLGESCNAIFNEINSIISSNNGVQLSFDNLQALSFETPNIKDLSFAGGEAGQADAIISCSNNFTQYAADIKNAYMNIKTAFEKIGSGSQIIDTSDLSSDPATQLKLRVSEIIDSLVQVDENQFKTVIENLNIAANNIKRG